MLCNPSNGWDLSPRISHFCSRFSKDEREGRRGCCKETRSQRNNIWPITNTQHIHATTGISHFFLWVRVNSHVLLLRKERKRRVGKRSAPRLASACISGPVLHFGVPLCFFVPLFGISLLCEIAHLGSAHPSSDRFLPRVIAVGRQITHLDLSFFLRRRVKNACVAFSSSPSLLPSCTLCVNVHNIRSF